jgi:hypothetical protein
VIVTLPTGKRAPSGCCRSWRIASPQCVGRAGMAAAENAFYLLTAAGGGG